MKTKKDVKQNPMNVQDEIAEKWIKWGDVTSGLILLVISAIGTAGFMFATHFMEEAKEFKDDVVMEIRKTNETLGEVRDAMYGLSAGQEVLKEQVNNLDKRVTIVEKTLRETGH